MASINRRIEPNPDDDDEEEEEEEEEEEDNDDDDEEENFHISASSSAPCELPLHLQQPIPPPPPPLPIIESTSRALIPFTGSFPAFCSSKPTIEASRDSHPANHASTVSHPPLAPSYCNTSIPPDGALAVKAQPLDADLEPERKGECREHKKRSKNWTRAETLALITLRTELAPRFAKAGRKTELWDEIAESLQKGSFCRDAQQCRDKWEKLMAGYKEVRDGIKHKDDNPYYEDLHPLLSGRLLKREREQDTTTDYPTAKAEPSKSSIPPDAHHLHQYRPFKALPVDGHYVQPFKTVVVEGHPPPPPPPPPPFKTLAMDAYPPPHFKTLAMGVHHHPPPFKTLAMDDPPQLPFRGLHTEGHHPRFIAMDNHAAPADDDDDSEERSHAHKKRKGSKVFSVADLHAIQSLLEPIIARQQMFFKELLDGIEKKEALREQMRQEREEKWRAEERTQRIFFTEVMQILTQRLGANNGIVEPATMGVAVPLSVNHTPPVCSPVGVHPGPKKRSKNWKRLEVLQLIKLRGEMEEKFVKSIRRAALWGELAVMLCNQGVRRDGKQCREKWDKLMSEYKDVLDGKKEKGDSPYYPELQIALAGGGLDRQADLHMSGVS